MVSAAWCLIILIQVPAPAPRSMALLDIKPVTSRPGLREAVPLLSASLASHLARVGEFDLVTADDVARVLEQEANREKAGCTEEGCLAALAGALNVQYVAVGEVSSVGTRLMWTESVLDQKTSRVFRRAQVQGETVEELVAQVEELALALSGKPAETSLDAPGAAQRLGFTREEDFRSFRVYRDAHRNLTVGEALTRFILSHNVESTRLAMGEALSMGGAALVVVLMAVISSLGVAAFYAGNAPLLAGTSLLVLGVAPVAVGLGVTGLTLTAVDALDRGRVRVREDGCCHDKAEIHDAAQRQGLRAALAAAVVVAGPAACTGATLAMGLYSVAFGVQGFFFQAAGVDVGTVVWPFPLQVLNTLVWIPSGVTCLCLSCLPLLVGSPVGALLLFWPEPPLVEESVERPPAASAAATGEEAP